MIMTGFYITNDAPFGAWTYVILLDSSIKITLQLDWQYNTYN